MAVYHFTYHTYQSWMPDHPRGYVRDGEVLPPDEQMAEHYRRAASQPPHLFSPEQEILLLSATYDICATRHWRFHAFATEPSHVHIIVSWQDFLPWIDVRDKIKNLWSLFLGRQANIQGRHWFSHDASRRRVRDAAHLRHLIEKYLPRHSGLFWREGDPPPPRHPVLDMRSPKR